MPRWYTFALAVIIMLMVTMVANAQCLTSKHAVQYAQQTFPNRDIFHLVGDKAVRLSNAYALLPPSSVIDADEMVIVMLDDAYTLFFKDGCAIGKGVIPLPVMRSLMRETLGTVASGD